MRRVNRISNPPNEVNWVLLQPPGVRSQPRDERLQLGISRAGTVLAPRKGGWMFPPRADKDSLQKMERADSVVGKYVNTKYAKQEQTCMRKQRQTFVTSCWKTHTQRGSEDSWWHHSLGSQTQQTLENFHWGKELETQITLVCCCCSGPGCSRLKAQQKEIQALSRLFFSMLRHMLGLWDTSPCSVQKR